jgi:cytosine/adenosine deaminase-related metal-dependent hydrolase
MEGRLLLKNCSVLGPEGRLSRAQAVVIEGPEIKTVAADATVVALPGDWVVACDGRLVMPGLVDCHAQLLAPLEGKGAPTAAEAAAISAHGLALGLRSGVTTHADLLALPSGITAGLEAQAAAARTLGARLIQAHACVTPAELDANAAAISSTAGVVRTQLGLWSSARCDDLCLGHAGRLLDKLATGVHLRLAESEEDLALTFSRFGKQVGDRLDGFGLLTPRSIGAFARSLDGAGAHLAAKRGTLVAPWVDAGHAAGFEAMLASGLALGPCTAGIRRTWDAVAAAVGAATTVARAGRLNKAAQIPWTLLFDGPARLLGSTFGSKFGAVAAGYTADLAILDAIEPGDAASAERLALAPVAWTIVAGRVVVREGQLLGSDFTQLAGDAAKAIASVRVRA